MQDFSANTKFQCFQNEHNWAPHRNPWVKSDSESVFSVGLRKLRADSSKQDSVRKVRIGSQQTAVVSLKPHQIADGGLLNAESDSENSFSDTLLTAASRVRTADPESDFKDMIFLILNYLFLLLVVLESRLLLPIDFGEEPIIVGFAIIRFFAT